MGMDSALRENLSMGLSDGLDAQIVAGDDGLLGTNGLTARTGDATATATFADYRGLVYDGLNHRWPVCGHGIGHSRGSGH